MKVKPVLLLAVLLLVASACAIFYYAKYRHIAEQDLGVQAEVLTKRLQSTIKLPDEKATLAMVTDKSKLDNSLLSADVENGDQILVFTQAKRAILYRPSLRKVINIYPLASK